MPNYGNRPFLRNNMMNSNMMNPNKMNKGMMSPEMMNPEMMNPNNMYPGMMSPEMMNPNNMYPGMMSPEMMHHNKMNQEMMNPEMMNPNNMYPGMMSPEMMNHNKMSPEMMNHNKMSPEMMHHNKMSPETMKSDMMNHDMMDMQHHSNPDLSEALELIKQAVEGETEDRLFYDYLIKNASSESDKEIIGGIRDNEIKHANMFRQIYYEHTGKTIPPNTNVNFQPPRTYCDGLKRALMGETNAVIKYRKILFAMMDRRHINMLTEIITDELRHGILYNFIIHSNDCKY